MSLNGRIARLEGKAPPKQTENHAIELKLHLFTGEEIAHIETLIATISCSDDYLYKLTSDQLDYLRIVLLVNELDQQESQQASEYRRQMAELSAKPYFTLSLERLVSLFLSIDENVLPDYKDISISEWQRGAILPPQYQLRRSWYRQRKAHIETEMARSKKWRADGLWTISMYRAEMLGWVEAFPLGPGKGPVIA
jgi:hypothetical protein